MWDKILRDYRTAGLFLAPDKGGTGGGTAGEQEPGTSTGDGAGDAGNSAPNAGTGVQFTDEQQKALDRVVQERLKRAKEKWDADAKAAQEKATSEAEKERLKAQAEWQKLAEQHEARVKALEPLEAEVKAYGEAIDVLLAAKLKELGEAAAKAVEALPGSPGPLAKLNWLTANEALFASKQAGDGVGTPNRDKKKAPALSTGPGDGQQTTEKRWVQF